MRVLVAPDKFRGTLSAAQAARAIQSGWLRVRPDDVVETVPLADGGEGTLETLVAALDGHTLVERVSGPLGDPIDAPYGFVPTTDGSVAVIEMARASGLMVLADERKNPRRTTTRGTGELIRAALERKPVRVIVCIGGSATNDGGAGMAQALGARLLDTEGNEIPRGGEALLMLDRIDVVPMDPAVRTTAFTVASDVDNPLTGPRGAAHVYGPQKGAAPEDVLLLDRALGHLAAVVHRDLGVDLRDSPGAGAAGGLGFGLMAFCGAALRPGVDVVMDAVGLEERLAESDLVITGEGKLDEQSLSGKTPAGVLRAARELRVEVAVVCGRAEIRVPDATVVSLVETFGEDRAMHDTRRALEDLAQALAVAKTRS